MALKYYIEYNDIMGISHRAEISSNSYTGDATQIKGKITLRYSTTDDVLEPIRGCGLSLEIESNVSIDFSELYLADEFSYRVVYFRNEIELFNGFILSDDFYESFTTDKWNINIECIDGIGRLKNLSYVDSETGLNFTGKQRIIEIIANCLKRTGINKDIIVNVDFFYFGANLNSRPLNSVFLNVDRFIKQDNNTTMSCEEVLRSILDLYAAVLCFHEGKWVVFKPNLLYNSESIVFENYDFSGNIITPPETTINFNKVLGSQINGFYPHHVNSNQQKSIVKNIGAYKVIYKYGLVRSLFNNIELQNISGVVDEWSISGTVNFPVSNYGVLIDTTTQISSSLVMTSDSFTIESGDRILFKTVFNKVNVNEQLSNALFQVILSDNTNTYYLNNNGEWKTTISTKIDLPYPSNVSDIDVTYNIESTPCPIDGDVYINIFNPYNDFDNNTIFIKECSFTASSNQEVEGENYTVYRETNPSSKVPEPKEVFNGSSESDLYYGTMYEVDQETAITLFTRKNPLRTLQIGFLMAEERMKMYSKPLSVFKGSVFGFFNYLSIIKIDGSDLEYMPIEYIYDSSRNITELKLIEIINEDITSDLDYKFTYFYGDVTKPTIN